MEDVKEEIKSRLPIEDVVGDYINAVKIALDGKFGQDLWLINILPRIEINLVTVYSDYVLDNDVDRILIENAIYNGKPLPEKHGRLIDADELYGDFIDGTEGYDCNTWNRIEIGDIIEDAPTIIEGSDSEWPNVKSAEKMLGL